MSVEAGGESLANRAAGSVLWGVLQKWAQRIGGFVTVAILARLLEPSDFGLVALASAFVPILYLLSDLGFSTYIVQSKDLSPRVLSTAFWFSSTVGAILCAGVALSASPLASLLGQPAAGPVLAAVSPSIFLVGLSSVPVSLMRRRMQFRALAIQSGIAASIGQVAAISLAFLGFGVWALVVQLLLTQLIGSALAVRFARFVPSRSFSPTLFREMAHFGTNVTAIEFVAMVRLWAETAIITVSLGATGLGYLNIAQRLIQTAQDLSSAAVVPVSTVVFAHVRDHSDRLARAYDRALQTLYIVVMPIMIVLAIAAPHIIFLAVGPNWEDSVAPTRALAIAAVFVLGASLDNGLFYGSGRPGRWLWYAITVDLLTVATTAYLVRYGITGVAMGFVATAIVATVIRSFMVARLLDVDVAAVVHPFLRTSLPASASALAGVLTSQITGSWGHLAAIVAIGTVVGLTHVVATRLLAPALFHSTLGLLYARLPDGLRRVVPFHATREGASPGTEGRSRRSVDPEQLP